MIDPLDTRMWISLGIEAASQAPAVREFNMGGIADMMDRLRDRRILRKRLFTLWAAGTSMALFGLLIQRIHHPLLPIVYWYTPLMSLPWIIALLPFWPKRTWLIVLLMLVLCAGAQWGFAMVAWNYPSLVMLDGAIAALLAGLIALKLGTGISVKPMVYLLLVLSGAASMTLLYKFGKRDPDGTIIPVGIWQLSVGTILVLELSRISRPSGLKKDLET